MAKKAKKTYDVDAFMGNSSSGLAYTKEDELSPGEIRKRSKTRTFGRKANLGSLQLRGLTSRHLEILALHLSGDYSNSEVAKICSISLGKVNAVLGDKLCQGVIEQYRAGQLAELEALLPKVTGVIRDTLSSGDDKIRLGGVDRFIKMSQQNFGEQLPSTNLSVTVVDARTRLIEKVREIIDITPDEIHGKVTAAATEEVLEASDSLAPAE